MIDRRILVAVIGLLVGFVVSRVACAAEAADLAVIKKDVHSHVANGGWKYDRYPEMQSLDANSRITVADLKGPGVIRQIHITRHNPAELTARGVVLEIRFDNADEPAVLCPLADFFGDGCNGHSVDFSSQLVECVPWNYNCYFAMPFKSRAQVILRNDTEKNIMNYTFVEWESLPKWNDALGYFHATYARKCFQLTPKSDETFFEVAGTGHVIGRQFSIVTNEPMFGAYMVVMEGNNEVDIDGHARDVEYLGSECSFGFCWGFRKPFTGPRCGITLVENAQPKSDKPEAKFNRLSVYRFHDQMPIRFKESLKWHINWQTERFFTGAPAWAKAVEAGGCWVDYATVHYWYQTVPGGFRHAPLGPVAERRQLMLHTATNAAKGPSSPSASKGEEKKSH